MDGGQRAVVALGHRVEHGDDLVAEHLADDDPARVHPQRAADQLGHGDRAVALHVGQPLLERDHVGVQLGEVVEAQLQGPLHGDEPLGTGIWLASARSSVVFPAFVAPAIMMFFRAATAAARNEPTSGLIVPLPTRSARNTLPIRARRMEIAGRRATSMTADSREPSGRRRSSCGLAVSNGRLDRPGVGGQHLDQLDQLVVALRDRLGHDLAAVGVAEEDPVAAVDVDVLDLLVLQQRLQPAHAEQRGVDRRGELLLFLGVGRRPARR